MGERIYINQALTLEATTNVDITGATALSIEYIEPDGTTGSWTATSRDDTNGVIEVDLANNTLDAAGAWTIWAKVTFSGGEIIPGTPYRMIVHALGT